MKPLQLAFETTVYWVDSAHSRYSEAPRGMRRFRSLDQAIVFVMHSLPADHRTDVRILTVDKTLMYDEIAALHATTSRQRNSGISLPSRRFGVGAGEPVAISRKA